MTQEDYQWLAQNELLLYTSRRMDTYTINRIYSIYNFITGETKAPNGCGACLRNTIQTVRLNYEKIKTATK